MSCDRARVAQCDVRRRFRTVAVHDNHQECYRVGRNERLPTWLRIAPVDIDFGRLPNRYTRTSPAMP
ncbi:hypothetical protein WK90_23375 [Burkholderia cepacia]|nr:hypothetical protein WK83_25865 [Burkholderia cepacia]KVV68059.1 hypothetical protein WK84_21285 [Burkholderia cepacia]KVV75586.1 hypothetical protein WK86_29550 [Burkholderia cepacia]KVV92671.1 hypothetical protein WK88_20650 [Burkholderia cepacia]KVW07390.1 hypothetical protein WK90_23375 [Burkholderia cepacia]